MSANSVESGYNSSNEEYQKPNNQRISSDEKRLQNEFVIEDIMMDSANGRLYTGYEIKSGDNVIIKQIPRAKVNTWCQLGGAVVPSEIYYHFRAASFDTNNVIIKPLAWFEKRSSFILIMERLPHSSDLFDLSKKYGCLSDEAAHVIYSQILQMIDTLNRAGIVHRDLKDENIVVDQSTLSAKLIDFGCATTLDSEVHTEFSGTPEFYPPEYWRSRNYTHESMNIWSSGVILYILLNGQLPCQSVDDISFYRVQTDQHVLSKSTATRSILMSVLQGFSSKRPSLAELTANVAQWGSHF